MKKSYLLFVLLLLVFPLIVFAEEAPKVLTLETSVEGSIVNFNGTTESGSHAVMCKLYNSDSEEIDRLSVAVNNLQFEGQFATTEIGNYTVKCANYSGGEFKGANATVSSAPVYHKVTFNTQGGSEIDEAQVLSGQKLDRPEDPTNGEKIFTGWFTDEGCTEEYDFNEAVTGDFELFAGWVDPEEFTVDFDTRCEQGIEPVRVISGHKVERPDAELQNENKIFAGWYEDETLKIEFDFNKPITQNTTIYAKWVDDLIEYNVEDEGGNSISFENESGHHYSLTITDYLSLSNAELEEAGVPFELYNTILNSVTESTKDYGTLLAFYNIELIDTDRVSPEDDGLVHDGPFEIRIKLTDDMKKYNTFKMVYLDDDMNADEVITLSVDGDYLVGTIPHLSVYVLNGSVTTNPKTIDNIYTFVIMLIISIIGISYGVLRTKKLSK